MKRWGWLALLLVAGCGAGGRAPAQGPSDESAPPAGGEGGEKPVTTTTESKFAEPPSSTQEQDEDRERLDLAGALALFDRSASELSDSGLDCDKACKALGSMERSMGRICDLVGSDDPERRCETAREKARAARERVEKHCPRCS